MLTKQQAQTKIDDCIDGLIEDGRRCYADLRDNEKEELTGLMMLSMSDSEKWEYVTEADRDNSLINLFSRFLISSNKDLGSELINQLKFNATQYNTREVDKIFKLKIEAVKDWVEAEIEEGRASDISALNKESKQGEWSVNTY